MGGESEDVTAAGAAAEGAGADAPEAREPTRIRFDPAALAAGEVSLTEKAAREVREGLGRYEGIILIV